MPTTTATLIGNRKYSREQLAALPTPAGTLTHRPVPHHEVIGALVETLGFRHITVANDQYAISSSGNKMFGVLDLTMPGADNIATEHGIGFSLGIRNSHDKSMRLAMTVGYRVFVCENMAFSGDFTPVLAKHSKNFSLRDSLSVGVDMMQRNFEPMVKQVKLWKDYEIDPARAKLIIYHAFIEGALEVPRNLAPVVHDHYFNPKHAEFVPGSFWSLSNAFTSAFKDLDPVPQFKATGELGPFLDTYVPKR